MSKALKELASRELSRREMISFVQRFHPNYEVGWVHTSIASLLDEFMRMVERKESPRLIVNVCPRVGKSTLISEFFPAYCLGHHPDWQLVCATYNQTLADTFGRKVRNVINDPLFRDLFAGLKLDAQANAMNFIATHQRGSYTAVGMGGALTGKGANCLPAGTMVMTSDGERTIESIALSPVPVRVLAYDGELSYKNVTAAPVS